MNQNTKKIATRAFLVYAAVNIFSYVLVHISYLFADSSFGEIFSYFSYYVLKALEFVAPPLIATLALLVFSQDGTKKAMLFTLKLSLARLFYSVPYYYIIFIYNYAYDSLESLFLSVMASALVVLLTFMGALISVRIAIYALGRVGKMTRAETLAKLPSIIDKRSSTDFLDKASLPLLVFAFLRFAFSFISEVIDTVSFFIEYRSDYTAEEIVTILINYVILLALLVASYLVCMVVKNRVMKADDTAN